LEKELENQLLREQNEILKKKPQIVFSADFWQC
jgi:hypothetical protein